MNKALYRIALGLFVAIAALTSLLLRPDGPPPDDADLMSVPAPPLADHENGYVTLSAAAELLSPYDMTEGRLAQMAGGERWDDALATRELAENERALATYERIARNAGFRSPEEPFGPARHGAAALRLARLLGLRAISMARAGELSAATDDTYALLRIGKKLESDPSGALLDAFAGLETQRIALGVVGVLLERGPPDASLSALPEGLREFQVDANAWRRSLAAEYRRQRALILRSAEVGMLDVVAGTWLDRDEGPAARVGRWLPNRYLVKPNDTLRVLAARVRELQARALEPCEEVASAAPAPLRLAELLRPNAVGRRSVLNDSSFENTARARCEYTTQLALTRTALAVRAFERERGVLPPTLGALVPAYLDAVPDGGFAGAPLRLDRARRAVSAGERRLFVPIFATEP